MNSNKFRKELVKIMPGYSWTVHRELPGSTILHATGIQTSGFNRLSTLQVVRTESGMYEVKSSGHGRRAPWLATHKDATLARALRGLQEHYEAVANNHNQHAAYLQGAREKPSGK